ncbi:hypothetical protein [Microcoleus sp. herbarium12]
MQAISVISMARSIEIVSDERSLLLLSIAHLQRQSSTDHSLLSIQGT